MPFLSKAQNAWGHSPSGVRALGGKAKVKEWEGATDYAALPERKTEPGVLTKAARKKKENG